MSKLRGIATEVIPFGADVLCRGFKVSLAEKTIANGTALADPPWVCDRKAYAKGEVVYVAPLSGLGSRDLHAMAQAPLMDANKLFLPAGRVTMDEYRARVAADVCDLSERNP